MKERRAYKRFELELPARVEIETAGKKLIFNLQTRDISAAGAFLLTGERLPEDARCQLEVTVPSDRIKELTGAQSLIKIEGEIVRATPDGVAVCFDGKCEILGLKGS